MLAFLISRNECQSLRIHSGEFSNILPDAVRFEPRMGRYDT